MADIKQIKVGDTTYDIKDAVARSTKQDVISDIDEIRTKAYNAADSQAVEESLAGKQDTLVSGTNIKTVGGRSLLGAGDVQTYVHVMKYEGAPDHVLVDGLNEALKGRFVMDGQVYQNFHDFCQALKPGHVILQLDTNILTPYGSHDLFENLAIFIVMGSDPDAEADGGTGPELYLRKLYPEASPIVPVNWADIVMELGNNGPFTAGATFANYTGGPEFLAWLRGYCDLDMGEIKSDLEGATYPTTTDGVVIRCGNVEPYAFEVYSDSLGTWRVSYACDTDKMNITTPE